MAEFILNSILWTLALYGLIEIIKVFIYTFTYKSIDSEGVYLIIAVKNAEQKIEGIIRETLFHNFREKKENIQNVIITDLGSTDETAIVLEKMKNDYNNIQIMDWEECKKKVEKI